MDREPKNIKRVVTKTAGAGALGALLAVSGVDSASAADATCDTTLRANVADGKTLEIYVLDPANNNREVGRRIVTGSQEIKLPVVPSTGTSSGKDAKAWDVRTTEAPNTQRIEPLICDGTTDIPFIRASQVAATLVARQSTPVPTVTIRTTPAGVTVTVVPTAERPTPTATPPSGGEQVSKGIDLSGLDPKNWPDALKGIAVVGGIAYLLGGAAYMLGRRENRNAPADPNREARRLENEAANAIARAYRNEQGRAAINAQIALDNAERALQTERANQATTPEGQAVRLAQTALENANQMPDQIPNTRTEGVWPFRRTITENVPNLAKAPAIAAANTVLTNAQNNFEAIPAITAARFARITAITNEATARGLVEGTPRWVEAQARANAAENVMGNPTAVEALRNRLELRRRAAGLQGPYWPIDYRNWA